MKVKEFSKILEKIKDLNVGHRNMSDVKIVISEDVITFSLMMKDLGCYKCLAWHKGIDY